MSLTFNCVHRMLYGYLKDNIFPVFITFAVGDLIALFFIAVYFRYTTERAYVLKVLGFFGFIYLLVTIYAILGMAGVTNQTFAQVKPIIGYIAIAAAIMLYGAPFEKVFLVLKHKTSVFIPFHMVIVGTINNGLWVIYTPFDNNWFMFVPNAICVVLGIAQLCLYYVYHPDRNRAHKESNVTVEFDDERSGIPITIVIETPKTDMTTGKHFPESPSFQLVHSPLAPLHRQ